MTDHCYVVVLKTVNGKSASLPVHRADSMLEKKMDPAANPKVLLLALQ